MDDSVQGQFRENSSYYKISEGVKKKKDQVDLYEIFVHQDSSYQPQNKW